MNINKIAKKLVGKFGGQNEERRKEWIRKSLHSLSEGRILDAGAGEQQYKKYCDHLEYVSQDIAEYDGQGDGLGLHTEKWDCSGIDIICDITNIPEHDDAFDSILCSEVLEHVPEPLHVIKEFSRLLKDDGKLLLTVPFCSMTHFAPYHYSSGFNRYWFEYHLPKYGFEILEITNNGNFFEYIAQEIRRIKKISEQYCDKKLRIYHFIPLFFSLYVLKKLSKSDRGSSEVMTYGYHVIAKKTRA